MWVIASLNRPKWLAATLAAIRSVGCSTPGIVLVGPDDALPESLPENWQAINRAADKIIMPAGLNLAFELFPDEPWYGIIGDRHIVVTPDWDRKLAAAAGAKGFASCDDGWRFKTGRMVGATVIGGDLVRAFGFLYPPLFNHCCGDDFWEYVGRRFKNWKRLPNVIVNNPHPLNGTAEADETHQRSYGRMGEDVELWAQWRMSPDFAALIGRVAQLVGSADADAFEPEGESERMKRARSRSVLLCVPVARAPAWQFTLAFAETCVVLDRLGITFAIRFMVGSSNLPRARNELCARFLASGYTDMVFIDDDMGWKPEAVLRLLASEHEVIAGVGRKRVDKPNTDQDVWCVKFQDGASKHLNQDEDGAVEVHRVGTGFMKIARTALEKMIAAHPEWKRHGNSGMAANVKANYYQFFRFDPDDAFEMGEDYVFCERWIELGGKVWIDPEIHLSHVGEKEYSGTIAEMMVEAQEQDREPQREAAE